MPKLDLSARAMSAGERMDAFFDSGHTIRALVELRAFLDQAQFWLLPESDAPVRDLYSRGVARAAEHGVNEAELKITLHA